MTTRARNQLSNAVGTRFALLICLVFVHCVMMACLVRSANDAYSRLGIFAIMFSVFVIPGIAIWWKFQRGQWHIPCIIASSVYLMFSIGGVISGVMTLWSSWWGLPMIAFEIVVFAYATNTLMAIQATSDAARALAHHQADERLERLRAVGGTCPQCNGTGKEHVNRLTKLMIAYGGSLASRYGAPVSGRQALREFEVECRACNGAGQFPSASEPCSPAPQAMA